MVEKKVPVIQKADKGNNIVIFNRNDYILKLGKILEDTFKFKRVNKKRRKSFKSFDSNGRMNYVSSKVWKIKAKFLKTIQKKDKFISKFCDILLKPLTNNGHMVNGHFFFFLLKTFWNLMFIIHCISFDIKVNFTNLSLKTDFHSVNSSCVADAVCWRMFVLISIWGKQNVLIT